MSRLSRIVSSLSYVIVVSSFIGCATFHMPFEKRMPKATATNPVMEIVCLWQQGEGVDPDGVPCKGFSGQILFLSRTSSTPVQVEGDVRIYLFDDQGTVEEQAKPLRIFDFANGPWAIHLTDTSFGPAYNVFIPYVRRGTANAECSLRVRLKPKQGPTVFSDFTNMQLGGSKKSVRGDEAKPINREEVDRMAAEAMTNELRRTTTISLGPNPKTTDITTASKNDTRSSEIQLASHEVVVDHVKESAEAERIRRLESMVQQLLEQKVKSTESLNGSAPTIAGGNRKEIDFRQNDTVEPDEPLKMSRRIRMRNDEEEATNLEPQRRRVHPLDDDQPSRRRSGSVGHNELAQEPVIGDPFDSTNDMSQGFSLQDQRFRASR